MGADRESMVVGRRNGRASVEGGETRRRGALACEACRSGYGRDRVGARSRKSTGDDVNTAPKIKKGGRGSGEGVSEGGRSAIRRRGKVDRGSEGDAGEEQGRGARRTRTTGMSESVNRTGGECRWDVWLLG